MPVPRFLRFPRLTRFPPFCPFLLFRMVISPYPGDRTCLFHVFSVFPDLHVFARFVRFRRFAVPAGDFTVSRRPNVPAPRFLRFPRVTRFRPFWPFLLFRLVISPYPGDRTCPFHVFSVFPDLHVFARFGRFCCSGWSFHHIQPTECARSTFSPFSPDLHVFARSGRFDHFRCSGW